MSKSLLPIKALRLQPSILQHLRHLGVFLAILPESKLTLVVVVFVLSSAMIFASLENIDVKSKR